MLNGLDLFSGGGGLAEGLRQWIRPVAYCEICPGAQRVLLSRMARGELPCAPIWDDVRTLQGSYLPAVDAIVGGFPCQDISVAGNGAGLGGERSGLVFEYLRLIGECRPRIVFMENVAALALRGLDRVLLELHALGYDARWTIVSAAEVGAPHLRERIWILAHANGHANGHALRLQSESERRVRSKAESGCDGSQRCVADESRPKAPGESEGLGGQVWAVGNARECRKSSSSMADAEGSRNRRLPARSRQERQGAGDSDGQGEDVAHSKSLGRRKGRSESVSARRAQPGFEGGELADASSARLERRIDARSAWEAFALGSGSGSGSAAWPHWLPQPSIRRGDDGLAFELDLIRKVDPSIDEENGGQTGKQEIDAVIRKILRTMWECRSIATSSPDLYAKNIHSVLPDMPYGGAYEGRNLGAWASEDERLRCLWSAFYTEETPRQELQRELLERLRKAERRKKMEWSAERVNRLRVLGNGVVPLCAEEAFTRLGGLMNKKLNGIGGKNV